jgi:hypothetical protein
LRNIPATKGHAGARRRPAAERNPDAATKIESAANNHAASGLLDGGVSVDQVDEADGSQAVARIFGGNDTSPLASALAGGGAGNSDLFKTLPPILAAIVLAYIGKQLTQSQAPAPATHRRSPHPPAVADSARCSAARSSHRRGPRRPSHSRRAALHRMAR